MSANMGRGVPPPRVLHLPALCTGAAAGWQMSRLSDGWCQAQLLPRNQTWWEGGGLVPCSPRPRWVSTRLWRCRRGHGDAARAGVSSCRRPLAERREPRAGQRWQHLPPSAPCDLPAITQTGSLLQRCLPRAACSACSGPSPLWLPPKSAVLLPLLWFWPVKAQGPDPVPVSTPCSAHRPAGQLQQRRMRGQQRPAAQTELIQDRNDPAAHAAALQQTRPSSVAGCPFGS